MTVGVRFPPGPLNRERKRSGGAGPRQLHLQKNLKHSKLNGGQRPTGLDQDSCICKKKAFEAQRGATSGGVGPRQLGHEDIAGRKRS